MKPQNTTQPKQVTKPKSTKPSITGGIFSLIALLSAGIAHFLTHADSRSSTEVTTAVGTVDSGPVADIASDSITGILSMPFIVGALLFALIAVLFTLMRLRKVKTTGLVISLVWIALSIWAIMISFGALELLKAQPAS